MTPLLPDNNIKCWILNSLIVRISFLGGVNVNYSLKYKENKYFGKEYVILLNVKHEL
jgi:hypothetical protein